ncbi:MAG: hypothetical protein GTO21_10235 [Armatimonadetes bacterium]|nr:hypothetical protein [Armatimonadota bacterium]NIM77033.1 hypothetical protein [Armatimonadota bacterium]NIN06968.1 hypothetical protein [Armatimonadota bacterium]NIT32275.1 hypothetical protein [Armatimonadota bacterium]
MRTQSNLAQQNAWVDASGRSFRYSQAQTRNNRGFFQRGQRWEDARYKEGQQRVVRVRAYSEAYFQISRRAPHLNQYLTMGENVLFVVNGQAVEIAEDGKEEFTEKELDELLGKQKAPAKRAFAAPQEQLVGAGILAAVPPAGGSVAALLLAVSIGVGALVVKAKSRLM